MQLRRRAWDPRRSGGKGAGQMLGQHAGDVAGGGERSIRRTIHDASRHRGFWSLTALQRRQVAVRESTLWSTTGGSEQGTTASQAVTKSWQGCYGAEAPAQAARVQAWASTESVGV